MTRPEITIRHHNRNKTVTVTRHTTITTIPIPLVRLLLLLSSLLLQILEHLALANGGFACRDGKWWEILISAREWGLSVWMGRAGHPSRLEDRGWAGLDSTQQQLPISASECGFAWGCWRPSQLEHGFLRLLWFTKKLAAHLWVYCGSSGRETQPWQTCGML